MSKKWTGYEVRVSLEILKDSKDLSVAFKKISLKTGRSYQAVKNAWYQPKGALKLGLLSKRRNWVNKIIAFIFK